MQEVKRLGSGLRFSFSGHALQVFEGFPMTFCEKSFFSK